ncbi:glycoside hydrolase family 55 protein [Chiua virens]|nr:glycoside hydrolase family 55 protein [Chiua virens]
MSRRPGLALLFASVCLLFTPFVFALGSSCTAPLTSGDAPPGEPYWLQNIKHQGTAAFNPNTNYTVFRNVMDYGAKGDGVTDDTTAINAAMSYGDRCGYGCESSTITPAIVYFPPGTYLVSSAIDTYYYTQMIGDARTPPTLLAAANFTGFAVIDADPYVPGGGGAQWFVNQNNFYRSVRNLVIDLRQMNATAPAIGLHWQVSQATSLVNVVVEMSQENGTQHQGLNGISVGNQQFTVRNITVNNAVVGINAAWSWGWTYQRVFINNCTVGFRLTTGGTTSATQTVGSEAIIDATVVDTPVFVQTTTASNGTLSGSIVLNNAQLYNVPVAVAVENGKVILEGSTNSMTIESWAQGNVYVGDDGTPRYVQGYIEPTGKTMEHCRLGRLHIRKRTSSVSRLFAGSDCQREVNVFNMFSGCKLIFIDAGTYYITDTLYIPAGTQIAGEAWSVILGGGANFQDQYNPRDIIFSTVGPAPGAILVEWNVQEPYQGGTGMWDTVFRLVKVLYSSCDHSEFDSTPVLVELTVRTCSTPSALQEILSPDCQAAFMALHLTPGSSAYLEGTWVWNADHDLDDPYSRQTSIFSGRGILSESYGPVWMIGTAEHCALYQYNLHGAQNHWIGLAQTETPYYQPVPPPPEPFHYNAYYYDPVWYNSSSPMAWAMYVQQSWDITIFGAGFYSFFQNYTQGCLSNYTCQNGILNIDDVSTITLYSISTVGTTYQLTIGEQGIINEEYNRDGFQETFTSWTRW